MTDTADSQPLPTPLVPPARCLELDDLPQPIDWTGLFGVQGPVEVEIGCGNGRYLRRAATERPNHLFLGVERARKYAKLAQERMTKYAIPNARVLCADANLLVGPYIAPGSIHALHVYFTDPWPKRRHAKRRLFQTPFLEAIHRAVRPGGSVFVKVDLFWYFEEILGRFQRSPWFHVVANGADSNRTRDLYSITGFEQKALLKKGVIYYLQAENLESKNQPQTEE